ncbi:MAG: adenine phosphoribosyltransferase [Planctomycetaceae bacterium]
MKLSSLIRPVADFPKPGIMFRDITPLLLNPQAINEAVARMSAAWQDQGITRIMAAESRGFIFGVPMAQALNAGFVPVRKPGKLPGHTHQYSYELEYGSDTLEIHSDAVSPGDRILLVDDLLATGGTIEACLKLARQQQAEVVGAAFLIELTFLPGRQKLHDIPVSTVLQYATENADEVPVENS